MHFLHELWSVVLALGPWMLLGAAIAGVLHVVLPADFARRRLRGPGGVVTAVAIGVPLPLCSCGVIPAALGLRKDGASRGAAIGFLVSTPQTGVDSILVSGTMLGWPFALWKVGSALVTGLVAGAWVEATDDGAGDEPAPEATSTPRPGGIRGALAHAVEIIRNIWREIVIGILVSAAIGAWVPPASLAAIAELPLVLVLLATLAIAVPLYVCATASVPIAAALVAGGFPPAAALVFLMGGPATNVATIGAVGRAFGRRALAIYLVTILGGSLVLAYVFDAVLGTAGQAAVAAHIHGESSWIEVVTASVLVALLGSFAIADVRRWLGRRAMAGARAMAVPEIELGVVGMNCQGCVAHLESTLVAEPGVTAAVVTLEPGRAVVRGTVDEARVRELVRAAGFSAVSQTGAAPSRVS
jgi:hypothetical protein